jgi:hypothetical protein
MTRDSAKPRLALAALALGAFVGLVVVETVPRLLPGLMPGKLRAVQRIYDARSSWEGMMRGDRELGFSLLADLDLEFPSEGRAIGIRTKAIPGLDIAYRDLGTPPPWDAIAIGDSFTFCDDAPAETCWVRRLGEETDLSIGTLGVNGYSNLAEARLLERVIGPLAPKLVLVGFFPNDFKDNLHFRNWTRTGTDDYWTWMRQQRRSDLSDTLANWSVLYRLIDAARRYGRRDTFEHRDDKLDFVFRADSWWKTVLESPGATPGYELTEEALRDMAETAERSGAKFVVLLFPFKEQVYWDVARRYTRGGAELDETDIDAPKDAVVRFLEREGIAYCDLTDPLRNAAREREQLYLRAGAHWTDAGNDAAAMSIAACLRDRGMASSRASAAPRQQ